MSSIFNWFQTKSISDRNIFLSLVSNSLGMFMLTLPVKILWMQQFLPNSQVSILIGWLFFSIVLLELPTGALADLVGKKATIVSGYVLLAISVFATIFARDFWQFGLVLSLQGLGESLNSGAREALTYDSLVQDNREQEFRPIFSKIMTYVQTSMVIATFAGGWLGAFDLTWPFIGFGFFQLVAAGLVLLMEEPAVDTQTFSWESYKRQTIDGTKHLFRSAPLARMALLYMAVGGFGWTLQRLLRDMILIEVGYQSAEIGMITGIFRLLNILFLAQLVKSKRLVNSGLDFLFLPLVMVVAYLPGVWLNQWLAIPVIAGVMMVGTGRFMILNPHLQERVESKYRATAVSAANLFVSLLLAANMFGVGLVIDYVGVRWTTTFYGLISLALVLPLAWRVRQDTVRASSD